MRNNINARELFKDNTKAIKMFLKWCKESEELCEYDYENLCVSLALGGGRTDELIHFHKGNILDWLEEQGYYISIPVRGEFKYITVVFSRDNGNTAHQRPIFSNSGVKDRNRAIIKGIQKAIEHLEEKL